MVDLRNLEKSFLEKHICPGDTVCDLTMGNGHDTLWLSDRVGNDGRVFAFDIQEAAIDSTKKLLEAEAKYDNVTLIHDSHSNVKEYVKCRIKAGVFNLGYLPGGDKSITTMHETTLKAVVDTVDLLDDDGIVLVVIYPGHEEGHTEGEMLTREIPRMYDRREICVSLFKILNSPSSPYFLAIEKK